MKREDQLYRWMTPCPQSIERDASVADAHARMQRFGVRHLPVLDGGELVGIVSDRDLAYAERFVDAVATPVGEVMTTEPFVAVPYALLADVADEMARKKYGAALVVDRGRVVGVFTTVDALRAVAEDGRRREPLATKC